jgi:hypothetical protein
MAEVNNKEGKMVISFSLQKLAEAFMDHLVICHFLKDLHNEVGSYKTQLQNHSHPISLFVELLLELN